MLKRVVIKLSGEGLAGEDGGHFDEGVITRIVTEIIEATNSGAQISLVVGGGNFWRGRDARADMDKFAAHQIGMLGTVMNGIYLSESFRNAGTDAVVMTPFDVSGFTTRFSKREAERVLESGKPLIFAGGSGHPFFSTDIAAALRACELGAGAVLYAKNIDCVYDRDPHIYTDALRYKSLSYKTAITDNLAVADISALCMTSGEDIDSLVFALDRPGSIAAALSGGIHGIGGTLVSNHVKEEFYV